MALNVIHVNDISLIGSVATASNTVSSAGAAVLLEDGLKIGNAAQEIAKIYPRKLNDTYWQTPSAEPLSDAPNYVRHHADLIHYQLKSLHKKMADAKEIVLAVPSNMDAEQLSIVLGVAQPLPFEFIGLIDLAVVNASSTGHRGEILHFDLQRYQTVITLVECTEHVARKEHLIIPNLGMQTIQDKWAAIIANAFVEQSRFDPMHTAQSEQTLYNKIPEWISTLSEQNALNVDLRNSESNYQAKLDRSIFVDANSAFMETLIARGKELSTSAQLYLGNTHLLAVQELSKQSGTINILSSATTFDSIAENQTTIVTRDTDLPLVTRLKNATTAEPRNNVAPIVTKQSQSISEPTHLLVDNVATALPINGADMHLRVVDNHLVTTADPSDAIATITHDSQQFSLLANDANIRLNNKTPSSTVALEAGDIISAQGGLSARLIMVSSS